MIRNDDESRNTKKNLFYIGVSFRTDEHIDDNFWRTLSEILPSAKLNRLGIREIFAYLISYGRKSSYRINVI